MDGAPNKARRKKGSEDVDAAGMSDVIFGHFQEVTRVLCNAGQGRRLTS